MSMFSRYPLLLSRVFRNTPIGHDDKTALKEAQLKVEEILEHINAVSTIELKYGAK